MFHDESFGLEVPGLLTTVFISVVGLFILFLAGVFIADVTQTRHAIRRDYPVIGHLRYVFEHLGTFFRQYFFTMDREEMPFNRALILNLRPASVSTDLQRENDHSGRRLWKKSWQWAARPSNC